MAKANRRLPSTPIEIQMIGLLIGMSLMLVLLLAWLAQ
jgi:hypothetical protein